MENENNTATDKPATGTLFSSKPVSTTCESSAASKEMSKYSIEDFATAFKTMDATPDIIRAALRMEGKEAYTKEEAQTIIKKYKNQEVKA